MEREVVKALTGLCNNIYANIVAYIVKGELGSRVEEVNYDNLEWATDLTKRLSWIVQTLKFTPQVELEMFNFDFIKNEMPSSTTDGLLFTLNNREELGHQFEEGVSEDVKNEILDAIFKD